MSKVLIVDDDPVIRSVYRNLLRSDGFEVQTAADGASGLRAIGRSRPDAVLLDLSLPDMGGDEVLQKIRQRTPLKKLPVVVLTAGLVPEQVEAAIGAEVTVLSKARERPRRVVEVLSRSLINDVWA